MTNAMTTPEASISRLLDEEFERLRLADGNALLSVVPDSIHRLATETLEISRSLKREEWLGLVQNHVDPHPIVALLSQDPYTKRARDKPRGYAGDAIMMDYCYFTTPPESISELGKAIFFATTTSPNARGSFNRAGLLASRIDAIVSKTPRPSILALACGHLREAMLSSAFRRGQVGRFIALDQDEVSLAVVKARYASYGVECLGAKVKSILKGELSFSDIDFIYAAGLFDYLEDDVARQLVANVFRFLKPGGQLLIGNFLPDTYGRGYMEAFMQWVLITRSKDQIISLADRLEADQVAAKDYFEDSEKILGYLTVTKC